MRILTSNVRALVIAMSLMLSQAVCVLGVSAADSLPVVRVATLKYGTANWELQVIKAHGLDRAHGFELDIREVNSPSAASIALQGGAADVAVQDWLWVLRQQDQGRQFLFAPYSTAVGRLVVPKGSSIDSLQALAGKRLGVAGGDSDKSWRLLNVLLNQPGQPTMPDSIKPRFGAPPLLNQLALRGDIDALLTYWHYAARLESEGFRTLLTVDELLAKLGIVGPVPMLGWCFSAAAVQGNDPSIARFLAAAEAARQRMAEDASVWLSLKPLMRVTSPAVFEALKAGFLAGAPGSVTGRTIQDTTAVAALYLNDKALAERMVPGIFWPPVQ